MDKYIGKTLKGKEFIDLFPEMSDKLAKLTNYEENHNGYIFKTGLNIDTKKFDADKKCGYGIYFTDIYNMILWMSYMRKKVTKFLNIFRWENEYEDKMIFYRKVTLPLDCNICIESRDKFKADKIILGERMRIEDLDFWKDENFCLRCVEKHNTQIIMMYIRNYSDKVNLALVKKDPFILNDLINRKHMEISEEIQLEAVKRNGLVIGYIKNPSEEVQLEAVKQKYTAIEFIENPSEKIQLEAVKRNGKAIKYIILDKSSEEIQLEAVKQNGLAISRINKPSEEVQLAAVKQNIYAIYYIKNPSEKVQIYVVKTDGSLIEYIKNPTKEVQIIAVRQDGAFIDSISDPSKDMQLAALNQNKKLKK